MASYSQWLRYALELEGTDFDETESARRDVRQDVLPGRDLSRPGLGRDSRRDVDRPTEVVALVVDHGTCITPTWASGKPAGWTRSTISSDAHRVARILEVEMHAVPQHLHDGTSMARSDLVDQLGELERDARRLLVAGLLGQPRVTGEVREHAAFDLPRLLPMHPRVLERGLDMIEQVLGLEHFRMPPVEPGEQIFPGPPRPNADLAERGLEAALSRRPRWRNGSSMEW